MAAAFTPTAISAGHSFRLANILVATDFSVPAAKALAMAGWLAQSFGSKLLIVHIADPSQPLSETALDDATKRLKTLASSEPSLRQVRQQTLALVGDPLEIVPQLAQESHADMIVLGSHGEHGAERLALGSTALAILNRVDCPVLIAGPAALSARSPLRSVLFATDLKDTPAAAAKIASAMAMRDSGTLTMFHVLPPKPPAENHTEIETAAAQELRALVPQSIAQCCRQMDALLAYGNPAEEIVAAANAVDASLIVVGRSTHNAVISGRPSGLMLSYLIQHARCGVLSLGYTPVHRP